ncbi:MAG: hypothetical protein KatS3mg068_0880 [Candidatus Sericytochromatia bacterium]|nr:MAG: hypothetical protein KatS3mg068_0880 [Candidatus Sericytochromatia bacterium]
MKKKELYKIYDRNYKEFFSNTFAIRELLETFVNVDLVKYIDFNSVEIINKSFILDSNKEKESDIIYKIKLKEQYSDISLYIVILLEFQSSVDKNMLYRMIEYTLLLYKELEKTNKKLPPVFPIVLYTGSKKWNVPNDLNQIVKGNELLKDYGLKFKYFLLDVNKYTKEQLQEIGNIISTLFLAEIIETENIQELGNQIDKLIENENNKENIKQLIKFILNIYKKDEEIDYNKLQEDLNSKFRSGSMLVENVLKFEKKARMKGFKEGIEKGKIEGLKEGELIATRNKLIKLLLKKFRELPKEIEEKINNCNDLNKLDLIIDNIFDISSLDEINKFLE